MGFFIQIRPEVLKQLREKYPPGCKVELIEMCDPYRNMPSGLQGEVLFVDDSGSVHVSWSNHSTLAVIYGIDSIRRIDQ